MAYTIVLQLGDRFKFKLGVLIEIRNVELLTKHPIYRLFIFTYNILKILMTNIFNTVSSP